jgi:hypothetical protein
MILVFLIIIGNDVLKLWNAQIDFKNEFIIALGKEISFKINSNFEVQNEEGKLYICQDEILPLMSEKFVNVNINYINKDFKKLF